MTITLVQSATFDAGGAFGTFTTGTKAYTSNVAAGNLLVCAASCGQNNTGAQVNPSVSDTRGNTWATAVTKSNATGATNPGCEWIFYAKSGAAGANSVTLTFTGVTESFLSFNIYEFHDSGGAPNGWSVDATASALSASTVSATASQNPSAAIGVTSNWTQQPTGVGASWTIQLNPSNIFTASAYRILTATGSYAPGFTPNTTSSDATVAVANFYPTASASNPFTNHDWPNPLRTTWYRDWEQQPQISQTVVASIPNQDDWPLPKSITWYREWFQGLLPLRSVVQIPFNQDDWPLSKTYPYVDRFWSEGIQPSVPTSVFQDYSYPNPTPVVWYRSQESFNFNMLVNQPASFFNNYDQPNPKTLYWYRSWEFFQPQITLQPASYFNNYDLSVPKTISWYESWNQSLLTSTLTPSSQSPFSQTDWPLPKTISWYQSWFENLLQNTLKPTFQAPFYQTDWSLSRGNLRPDEFYNFSNIGFISQQPASFFNNYDFPNPQRVIWDIYWSQNQPFGTIQAPTNQSDWPNPFPIKWYEDWHQALAPYFPVSFPNNQTDWQNPKTWTPIDQWWFNNLINLLTATPASLPFNQSDWPLPRVIQPIDPTWLQALVLNLPEPPPPPPQSDLGGKTWTREQWTKQLEQYALTNRQRLISQAYSRIGKLGGRPSKHS